MMTNVAIEQFSQELYKNYNMGTISYGYNPVSETYIVRVENESLMHDESFLSKIFDFTHSQARLGEWVMFVSPSDSINFEDYKPVVREIANTNTQVDVEKWVSELFYSKSGWSETYFESLFGDYSKIGGMSEDMEYALAA